DHDAYRGLSSVGYALTQRRRAADWRMLAGNHVLIDTDHGVVALCHLRQGSVAVRLGQHVDIGDPVGTCGNSGNSTEPHLHMQAIDGPDPARAHAVSLSFRGRLPRNGEIIEVN
ncbi:MAG: M23 family metallopeptidase, partial [Microbacterium sp.]